MTESRRRQIARRLAGGALLALNIGLAIERAGAQQQGSAGANVNVISGSGADGDWTLQRQNEPSIACSSRNPLNCLAGANDYRTVDIPFPTSGERVTGDAWLGWYTTKNGGLTWRTRLLPGYPQDTSAAGLASPLRGYAAGADPVIRPGTNGLFFYGGLVFNREEGGGSAIFVARFIDNNNQEGTAGEPIDYLGASIVHRIGAAPTVVARGQGRGQRPGAATAARRSPTPANTRAARVRAGVEQPGALTQLVDKPWMAVDVPRAGAQTCSIGGPGTGVPLQTFPGGRVYMAYALFDDPGEQRGRIMFSSSANCGATWSAPRVLSRVPSADVNDDGVATIADVTALQASVGRSCGQTNFNPNADTNNDCTVNAVDLNFVSRGVGRPVPTQPRLSQGATIAIDPQTGAVQVAWRQFDDGVLSDAVVTVRSTNGGGTFSAPRVVANFSPFEQGTTDTSFRTNAFPTMAMDGTGRAYLAWSARGYAIDRPSAIDGDGRVVLSTSTDGITWSAPRPIDNQQNPGHQIMPALAFAQGKLQLIYYDLREDVSQLFGPYVDELPILAGPPPRVRHTVDVWGAQADPGENPAFTAFRISQYRSGSVPGSLEVQQLDFNPPNLPIFRAGTSPFVGDYLDVATEAPFVRNGSGWSFNTAATASPVFHGVWTDNRDIRPPANGRWTDYTPPNPPFPRPAMSGFDPTQAIPPCVPGQAGMRNQNIYTARITRGLVVGAVGNSRRLGSIQRSFPVFAQNNGTTVRSYRLTITNQPVGGQASFKQFEQLTTLDVEVPRRSTVARTVFARSSDPFAQINVSVTEISAPGGAPVAGGQQGTIVLNPDPTNPDLENPDLENPDLENPDLENAEVHNPDLENATTRNPDLENPDLENPDLENPDLENTRVANPSIINPDLENPDLENPDLENPDLENPDLENPDLENGALSDTTWTVTNKGNTASAYTVRLALNRQLPEGFRGQLIAHKVYQTPAALGCSLLKQSQTVLLANIPTARFVAPGELANPDLENPDLENLTVVIAPGETVRITLRVYDPVKADAITFRAAESVTPVAVAQAVNTPEADAGVTQPAAAGVLTSSEPVPGGTSGGDYSTALSSILPGTWTVAGGTVPPGLTVDSATGAITGTPTTPGTYTFTARFESTAGIIDYRTVTITVGAVGADANVGVTAIGPTDPVSIGTPFAYSLNVSNAGPAAATNVRLTDTLPEGTQFVSATTTLGTCQHANGTLLCNLGTLASGSVATIVLNVRPTIGGTHTNTAVVTATESDPIATNNSAVSTASTLVPVTACTTVCFSGPTSYIAGPADQEFGAEKGDFNGDGFVDVIYGPVGVNTVGIMLANGTGGFGPPSFMTIPGSPGAGAVADFNNDGHQDLVLSSEGTAQAWVFLGNGLGQFGAPAIIALPNTPGNVAAADFNRDGNVDLALSGSATGPLAIILNGNGNGTFQPPTTIGTTTTFSTVVTDDVNNDTNPDLVVHQEEVGLVIILGSGASGFQPPTTIPVANISGVIKTGDLTGDGFADLILGSVPPTGAELHLYVGDGAGGFTQSAMIGDPLLTDGGPAVGDLDSDGDLDVVWARSGGGVGIQLNNGSGTFAAPIYLSSPQAGQILVADYNGDGRPDLALLIGGEYQSQFLVFLNTCDQPPAELAVTLAGPTDPVVEGSPFTYNAEVTNNGPNPATGVQLDLALGQTAELVAIGGSPASCSVVRNRVTCQLGTLASGTVSAFAIDVLPRSGGTLQATAGVTATTSDPDASNNAAFATTTVAPGASTLVVTNTNQSGPGSLFQAIADANDPGPADTITFNIPGAGPHTITPTRRLPDITQPVVIDGTTQPGYAGTPLIEISGQNAGPATGLFVNTANSVIRGLAINRFQQAGIALGGAGGHRVEANFIGTNTSGTAALGNLQQGVFISSPNNVIGGATAAQRNVISGNTAQGVIIASAAATGNVVSGNFIGSDATGTARIPNGFAGVAVTNGASNNTIGGTTAGAGNLISGNTGPGVNINGAGTTGNTVAGNFIGTNASGSAALFNGNTGVVLNTGTTNNTVGGTTAAARNVISGNNQSGVSVSGVGTSSNTVAGNFIGTNAVGTAAIPNGNSGITINGSATNNTIGGTAAGAGNVISGNPVQGIAINTVGTSGNAVVGNFIGTNAAGTAAVANGHGISVSGAATNNTIGGAVANARNVIAGNTQMGVRLVDAGTTGNRVLGNFIGTNATGTAAVPNGAYGVDVSNTAGGNAIGGEQTGEGNVISGNSLSGVAFRGAATDAGGNTLVGNLIGTDATGATPIGNALQGVFVMTSNNRIGSLTPAVGNTIAFNGDNGVGVASGTGNAIVNNRIFSNGNLGIDLGNNGVTPNDTGDADAGANNLQNFPLLVAAVGGAQGTLNSTPSGTFRIEFFGNTACDSSGRGEGAILLGATSVTTDASGNATIPPFSAAAGQFVTATATDASGNTSEFSACVATSGTTAELAVTNVDSPDPIVVGGQLVYTITITNNGPTPATNVRVSTVWSESFNVNASSGTCEFTPVFTCTLGTLASGANAALSIVGTPGAIGSLSSTATVQADEQDPVPGNNSATATTTVTAAGPLTFVVTNTNDTGAGSLRQAILDANAHAGADTITFAIPGSGASIRTLFTAGLPTITDAVTIDGTTQAGFAGTPIVELTGIEAPPGANGLTIGASDSIVRGLIINRFGNNGIVVLGGVNNRVEGNWIGLTSAGTAAAGNGTGVRVSGSGNTVGGTTAATRNVISGNLGSGVIVQDATSSGNVILGNFVGTNAAGTAAVPNQGIQSGIFIQNAPNNTVGGTAAGAGNVISGNTLHGLTLVGGTATGNLIQGNLVGSAANGTTPLGNGGIGIDIVTAPGNTIGGAGSTRNLIANNGSGMQIRTGADNNIVRNNAITSNGGPGIRIDDTSGNTIGGLGTGDGNIIQNNGTGIVVLTATSAGNGILGNSISANTFLGIDIDQDGVTANDANDLDSGPNGRQNFPILAVAAGGVQGTLNSTPNGTFRIEFFGNAACDASGNGEGATFLGATSGTTDGTGNATIPLFTAAAGQFVTATATDASNNTSEFSACVLTAETPEITLAATDADAAELGGNTGTVVVTRTGPTTTDRDVDVNISGTAFPGSDYDITSAALITFTAGNAFTLRIPAGQTAATLTITPVFSAVVEGPETVILSAEGSSATVTIADEPAVTLTATDSDAAELGGNTGTVVVTRPGPTTYARDIGVFISGTAFPGSDYDITSPSLVTFTAGNAFTLRIPAGETTATVTITPIVSAEAEVPETVVLSAEGSSATVTIVDQFAPLALTVTNTNDSGAGSLRAAILAANANTGVTDTIGFDIPGPGPHSIALVSVLPVINDPVIIDGTTDPDFAGVPIVELVGTGIAGGSAYGLRLDAGSSTVRGLVINRFSLAGIQIVTGGANLIAGNYIGTDTGGTLARANGTGIIVSGSVGNTIGGTSLAQRNVIAGNQSAGINIDGGSGNTVQGNLIGLDVTGTLALGNGAMGISVFSSLSNLIGGTADGAGNVIAASTSINLSLQGASNNNTIQGNRIGTNAAGTARLTPAQNGVYLIGSTGNLIGGTVPAARNLISGGGGSGQVVLGIGSSDNTVQGNYIGTDVTGTTALTNSTWGIQIGGPGNTIGGAAPGAGNVISGNQPGGIVLFVNATGNTIHGNRIGTAADGVTPVANNGYGIGIQGGSGNAIGLASAPNVIAFNTGAGISITLGTQNAIQNNAIFTNGGLGIDLGTIGVTGNDTGDADQGPNNLQNFPVLTAAAGGVEGTLNSAANATFRIEFFGNTACDASGNGEGATFLGATTVTTDGTGNATIPLFTAAPGQFVTATATDPSNNTSEFSACVLVSAGSSLTSVSPASGAQGATLDVTLIGVNTAFAQGASSVSFGQGISVNSLTVANATSITANITISPTAFTGGRTVTVTTGTEVVSNAFAVTSGPAAITSISPTSARQGDSNISIAVAGQNTHFVQGVTTASLGGGVTVNFVTVNSPTSATVNVSILPFAQDARAVTMTTDGENAVSTQNAFQILPGTPRLTVVSPASAPQGQTLNVSITGLFTSFVNGTTVADFGAGITVNSVAVTSSTTATVNVTVSPLATIGSRTVTLTTGTEAASSLDTGSFVSVTAGSAAISQVSPSSGRQAENLTVAITGSNTHFANGSTVVSFGGDINVTSVLVNSPTSATVDISIPASATLGLHAVTVTTLGEVATLSNAFTVTAGLAAVSTVSPSTGRQAETLNVGVTGQLTHFVNNTTTASFGSGITVNSVTVTSPTFATVNITIAPGAALGARTVTLTTGTESAQQVGGFTVTAGQPTLFSISPVAAVQGTNTTVTLNGAFTNFTPGITTAFFGAGITVGTVTVNGPTLASVPITITAGAQVGLRSVSVSTGSEVVTLLNGFMVLQGVATVSGIDPNAGQRGLTRNVNITGAFTNWQSGITSVSYGAGVTVNSNVVNSATSVTTSITIDAAATLGPRDVVVTTGAEVLTVPGGFVVTDADTTVPSLMTISPPSGATGVPLNPGITAEFNEPLDRTTLTPSTFQLYDTLTGQTLAVTVSLDATGRVARLVPSQVLAVSRQYYSYLTSGITDVAGNHFGGQIHYFTTGFSTETTGPTLRLANPQGGDTNIGRNAKITLQFDRPINSATRATGLRIQTGGVNVSGTYVLEDSQRRIRFTPATQLASSTNYTITLTTELRDVAGNSLTNPGSFVFTTGTANDTTAPLVSANTPAYNDTEIGLRPEIRVSFSEPINPISISGASFYLYNPVKNIYVKSSISIALDRRSALLTPDAPLEPSTQYYYYLASFEDLAGNVASLGGVYFRTGLVTDTTPPAVVSVDPANGATGVPVNARVRVAFSEMIDATSLSASTLQLSPAVSGTLTLSADRLALLLTPSTSLAVSTEYTVQVSGVRDSSGNVMTPVSTSFSTGASSTPDTTPPTVVSFSPANGSTNVSVNSPVVMTVSEPIRLVDFSASMRVFANIVGYGQVQMPGTYSANPARTIITFTPTVQYPGATQIQAYSNYSGLTTDLAGNTLQSTAIVFTTAAAADTTPPTIVLVTPSDGATGIGPQAVVTLTFSEPLLPTTISANTFALFAGGNELSTSISRSSDSRSVFLSSTLPFDTIITVVATGDVTDLAGNPLGDFSSSFTTGSTFDASRPQIVTQRPTGPGINGGTDVTLFVNKALDTSTVPGAFYLSQNGVLVEGILSVSGGGTAVHFDPATTLAPGALVQVFVTGDAADQFGNALFDYSGSFTVSPDPTTQPPTVVRSSPTFYSNLNPTNAVVDVEFSEPLLAATVTSSNLYVVNALGQPLAGTLELRSGNRVVRFRPQLAFAAGNYNYVYMTSGLRDLQNTPFAGSSFYFYTGTAADPDAPVISSVAPPAGAVGVGVNATIRLYLNEGINPLTISSATLSLTSSAGAIPVSATFNGPNTIVTLVPQAPLPAASLLTVNISGLEDTAGNVIAPQSVQFTTGAGADTVRPSVVATNVAAYGVTNVPTNTVFTVTFDEPMDAATVLAQTSTFLYDYSTGYKSGTGSLSSDGRTYTFVPSGPMAVNRAHSINLNQGSDLSGNQMFSYSLYFTTALAADTTPPTVTAVNPPAGAAAVPRNAQVEVRFSEPVTALSLANVRLLSGGTTPVAITRTLSDNNRLVTLRPNSLLAQNRSYTISVAGVRDTSDNLMAGTFTSTFATGARTDLVAPVITGANPGYDDSGVGVNMIARLAFSEPVDAVLLTTDTFRIANVSGGPFLDAVVSVAADRRSATLTPTAPLLPYTRYYYQLSTIADVAGNAGSGATVYFYTGAGADTTPPAVVSIAPPNAAPALPVNTRVTVVMSELIDATSVSNASIQLTPAAAGTVALAADRVTLTFTPSANLLTSTAYSVLVSGLRDTSSNTMTAASFGFTTSASSTPDTTAPAVLSRTPTNGSAGVGVGSLLTITTSERITAAAVGPSSVPVFAVLPSVGTFQLAGQYTVDSTGTVITFAVTGAFPANSTIQWYTNYNSSIRDMAGLQLPNQFAQFTTANVPDTNGPTVLSVTPTNGATNVGPYATVSLTFSEAVNPNTVTSTTVALFAGSTRLSPSINRSTDNRMVFLSMALPLDETITVFVTSGVTDLSGNTVLPFSSAFRTAPEFDISRPQVITQRPSGSGVAVTSPITLFLNQPVNPSTVPGALYVAQNGFLIAGTISVGWSNQAITFTPAVPYAPQATIEISLTDAARDSAGNPVNPYFGSFTTTADPATAAPVLVRTNPGVYSSGNPTNVVLDLEFSEPLNPASVTEDHVFLRDSANNPVEGTLSRHNGNRVVRFTADAAFRPGDYTYVYFSGLTDLQGTSISSSSFYFYTGTAADTASPSVTYVNPATGTAGVGVNGSVRITFSEPVNVTTLTADNIVLSAGGTPLSTTFTIAGGNQSVTVTPQLPLPTATPVTVTITGVEDVAGHAVTATSSTFTTGNAPDTTAPTVVSTSTVYGDSSVPVNSIFEWSYSEPIDVSTVLGQTNVLYDYTIGYVAGGSLSVSADARIVTYVPPSQLAAGRTYSVNLGSVADLAGNFGGSASIYFTTSTATDLTAPQVVAVNPAAGATGVPLNARIRLAFDEPVSASSLTSVNVLVSGLPLPVTSRTLSNGDRVVTLTLTSLLTPGTLHTISAVVKDRAGNAMPAFTSTFTTGSGVDLINLAATTTPAPAGGATGVSVTVAPSITFNEAIDPTTIVYGGTSGVTLLVAATGQVVPLVYSFSADRRTVIMTPVSPLAAGTQYRIQASSVTTDLAGNVFPTTVQFLFTTLP